MATANVRSISVSIRLDNGTDAQGNTKTVGVPLGGLSKDNFNMDKVLAISDALEPCLSKSVERVEKTEVSTISA